MGTGVPAGMVAGEGMNVSVEFVGLGSTGVAGSCGGGGVPIVTPGGRFAGGVDGAVGAGGAAGAPDCG